ncbi:MAG TPA: hypothetical protein VGK67_14895 [Myxococcales bacterium]|jgi:hypothetical protein
MAATSMVFVGWHMPRVGREIEAIEHFTSFTNYLDRMQKEGHIDSYEPMMLTPHGGDLTGFVVIRGDHARLHELRRNEIFVDHITRAEFLVENMGVVDGYFGDGVRQQMMRYQKLIRR